MGGEVNSINLHLTLFIAPRCFVHKHASITEPGFFFGFFFQYKHFYLDIYSVLFVL